VVQVVVVLVQTVVTEVVVQEHQVKEMLVVMVHRKVIGVAVEVAVEAVVVTQELLKATVMVEQQFPVQFLAAQYTMLVVAVVVTNKDLLAI
jgi:hypothetical protein